jgi:Tol biopolymer transport system component
MRMRTIAILVALLAAVLWAAPAEAKLVYVKHPGSAEPVVFVAKDSGKDPRRLGVGRAPTISPDGQWVAFVTVPTSGPRLDTVVLQKLDAGAQRLVMRSRVIDSLRFSADSTKLGAIAAGKRVRVYDIPTDTLHVATEGEIRGYSFSPNSKQIVFGRAKGKKFQAPSDLFTVPALGGARPDRVTDFGRAMNPVWGPKEIYFDRYKRRKGDAPAFNLWALDPAKGGALRRLTQLKIPNLVSGLVPLEASENSRRLLAVFSGQDTELGFTVQTRTGKTRSLSKADFEHGTVGFDLSRDGRRILGHTGGPDPQAAHDVVSVPYGGGKPKVLVEDAAYPDWTR